ncbi:carbon-nitrogen hydrolase family protein [Pseudomonas sp. LP_7_YM]|uniref:carbon-nitrogen hydrolase family protein n=1 Tax=Pseudomonas sp. LP_7_YM TaxID=2485137 RepID=UPI001060E913|nr:carbon-nitrogen hydrolase family protein [Pseudomonas sp. LP_7_YM]TDV67526.1 putative amidohydrolase [Pseudomonas sp. LP_7_YM]
MQVSEQTRAPVFAVAQSSSMAGDIEGNVQRHLHFMEIAAGRGANFLMFPELSLTGYEPTLAGNLAFSACDPRLQPMRDMARELKMVTVAGAPIRSSTPGQVLIAALVFQADGGLDLYYKQHLHSGEESVFGAGTGGAPVDIAGERLALAVCADFAQVAHAKKAAEAGSTIYAASVLISGAGYAHDSALLSGYARTHRMSVLMANYAGSTGGWLSGGRSALWDEDGEMVAQISGAGEELLLVRRSDAAWSATAVAVKL